MQGIDYIIVWPGANDRRAFIPIKTSLPRDRELTEADLRGFALLVKTARESLQSFVAEHGG